MTRGRGARPERLIALSGLVLLVAVVGTIASGVTEQALGSTSSMPNILIIVADDQRIGTDTVCDPDPNLPSCTDPTQSYVNPRWMPKVKKWFRSGDPSVSGSGGTAFQQAAFAVDPLCCPSRASIFTGRYPHNHGVKTLEGATMGLTPDAGAQPTTLQHYLQMNGYRTGIYGKYLNNWDLTKPPPYFDYFGIFNKGYSAQDVVGSGGLSEGGPGSTSPIPLQDTTLFPKPACDPDQGNFYSTTYVADKAVEFIDSAEASDDTPWFLYVAPFAPHPPSKPEGTPVGNGQMGCTNYMQRVTPASDSGPAFYPSADVIAQKPRYVRDTKVLADIFNTPAQLTPKNDVGPCPDITPNQGWMGYRECVRYHTRRQYRALKSLDDLVGSVFNELKTKGDIGDEDAELNRTLAFYVSDNGVLWGEFYLEGKPFPYSSGARIPFLMRWPNHVAANASDPRLVANIDIAPTALAAADILPPASPSMDGRNLFNAMGRIRLLMEQPQTTLQTLDQAKNDRMFPLWASIRQSPQQGSFWQYTENYLDPADHDITQPPGAPNHVLDWQEFYTDLTQLTNVYGSNGNPTPSDDSNPPAATLSSWLSRYLTCSGPEETPLPSPPMSGPVNCP